MSLEWYEADREVWNLFQPITPPPCCPEPDVADLVTAMENALYKVAHVPGGRTHLVNIGPVWARLLCSGRLVRRTRVLESSGPPSCSVCSRKPQAASLGLS